MANPNIASLTELYGGTLAWQIEPKQPVYAYSSKINQTITGWTSLDGNGNMDLNSSFTIPDALDNRVTIGTFSTANYWGCLLYTSPRPRDGLLSRMTSSA